MPPVVPNPDQQQTKPVVQPNPDQQQTSSVVQTLTYAGDVKAADAAAKKNDALWYTFDGIGRAYLVQRGTAASTDAGAAAVHGYNTIEEALKNPNSVNGFSQATITQWNEYASLPVGGGTLGMIETVNVTVTTVNGKTTKTVSTKQDPTTAALKQAVPGIPGISSVTDFLQGLTSANLWIRAAKIVIGGTILIVGLVKLTGADKAFGGAAATAVKISPFL